MVWGKVLTVSSPAVFSFTEGDYLWHFRRPRDDVNRFNAVFHVLQGTVLDNSTGEEEEEEEEEGGDAPCKEVWQLWTCAFFILRVKLTILWETHWF